MGFCVQAKSCSLETIQTEHNGSSGVWTWRSQGSQTILLFLSPIEESVDHVDSGLRDPNTWVGLGQVNRMGIKTNGLSVSVVMSSESGLHIVERGTVIGDIKTVGLITKRRGIQSIS